jgi:AraC-like DNA-binding protein
MNIVQSSLFSAAISVCVLCALLARGDASPQRRYRYFLAYLVIEAVGFALEWLILHPTSPTKALWLGGLMGLSFFVAPCLWLFAREVTENDAPDIRSLPARHFIVVAAGLALTLPLMQTAHPGPDFADMTHTPSAAHSLFIHTTMLACVILFLCQAPYYLRECIRILTKHTNQTKALFSNLEDKSLNALRVLIFAVLAKWLVGLLRALFCLTLGKDTDWGLLFASLEVSVTVGALIFVMRQSTVFSVDDRKLVQDLFEEPADPSEAPSAKYARSSLDQSTRIRIQRKLQDTMTGLQRFRDSRLTLHGLCRDIKENPHYVSQVINQDLRSNFYDFVNGHRVDSAKRALAGEPDKTVLEIALDVGFNSKSTFNAAFRRHAGMTPTEYRKSLQTTATDADDTSYPDGPDARTT